MTMERCHLLGRAIIAVEPGVGHVRLSESDTPCQRLCRPGTTGLPLLSWWCPLPHSGEPACWRDWDQGPPNCPTHPPPYLTQHHARGEWELTNKMTCGRSPRLGGRNKISKNVIKPLSRSAYQLCICRQGRIIGHRDNPDNATSAARR